MKKLSLYVMISLLVSLNAPAKSLSSNSHQIQSLKAVAREGGKTGSGGEVWVCRDKTNPQKIISTILRDYKEELALNKSINAGKLSLGDAKKSIKEKVLIILERLKSVDITMYRNIVWAVGYLYNPHVPEELSLNTILDDLSVIKDVPGVVTFVKKLKPQNDANSNIIFDADGCSFEQAAVQAPGVEDLGNNPLILIKEDVARTLLVKDRDSFAGLIAHELIILGSQLTYNVQLENTDIIRSIQGKLATDFFKKVSNRFSVQESYEREIARFNTVKSADLSFKGLGLSIHPLVTVSNEIITYENKEAFEADLYFLAGNSYVNFARIKNCSGLNCDDTSRYIKLEKDDTSILISTNKKGTNLNYSSCKGCIRNESVTSLNGGKLKISYINPRNTISVITFGESIYSNIFSQDLNSTDSQNEPHEITWEAKFADLQTVVFENATLLVNKGDYAKLRYLNPDMGVGFNEIFVKRVLKPEEQAVLNISIKKYDDMNGKYPCNNTINGWKEEIGTEFIISQDKLWTAEEICTGHSLNE